MTPPLATASLRYRLFAAMLLALWLVGQQLGAEHALDHAHHDADCAVYLAAAGPGMVAAASLPPPLATPAGVAVHLPDFQPRSTTAHIRNRGPPAAPHL